MRIRKIGQVTPSRGSIVDSYNTSTTDGYSANYINNHSVVVSATEPTTDRKKVWMQSNENIFDGVLESGTITDQGVNADNPDRKRSKNYLKVKENQTYTIRFNGNANVIVLFYSSNKTFLSQIPSTWGSQPYTFTTPTNTAYIRFISQDTTTTKALIKVGNEAPANEIGIEDKTYTLRNDNVYEEFNPQNEIYSTGEIIIGTYKGKPLYRRVVDYSVSADWQTVATTNNVDEYVTIQSTAKTSYVIPFYLNSTSYAYFYVSSNKQNVILASAGLTGNSFSVILEYTKTTDD